MVVMAMPMAQGANTGRGGGVCCCGGADGVNGRWRERADAGDLLLMAIVSRRKNLLCACHVARLQGGADLSQEALGIDAATRGDLSRDLCEGVAGA
jgi:hypothetical protein